MENQNQIKTLGTPEAMVLGPIPCNGAVCIPRTRYDELLRAENAMDALRRAYQTMSSFNMSSPVIKCKKRPRKKCSFVAEVKGKR